MTPADVVPTPDAARPMSFTRVSAKKLSESLFVSRTSADIGGDCTDAITWAAAGACSRAPACPGEIPSAFIVLRSTPAAKLAGFDWKRPPS